MLVALAAADAVDPALAALPGALVIVDVTPFDTTTETDGALVLAAALEDDVVLGGLALAYAAMLANRLLEL